MRFPCFLVVTLHHRCQLTSLEKTVARELSSSDGKEEGRENTVSFFMEVVTVSEPGPGEQAWRSRRLLPGAPVDP